MQAQHLVRASDPLTSVMAAERSTAFSGGHCARILAADARNDGAKKVAAMRAKMAEMMRELEGMGAA